MAEACGAAGLGDALNADPRDALGVEEDACSAASGKGRKGKGEAPAAGGCLEEA